MWFRKKRPDPIVAELNRQIDELRSSLEILSGKTDALGYLAIAIDGKLRILKENGEERDAALLFGGQDVQPTETCH